MGTDKQACPFEISWLYDSVLHRMLQKQSQDSLKQGAPTRCTIDFPDRVQISNNWTIRISSLELSKLTEIKAS